jgi:hypothetical protein
MRQAARTIGVGIETLRQRLRLVHLGKGKGLGGVAEAADTGVEPFGVADMVTRGRGDS